MECTGVAPIRVHEEIPPGLFAQIQTQEAEVQVQQAVQLAGQSGLDLVPVLMGQIGQLDLDIGAGAAGSAQFKALGYKVFLLRVIGWRMTLYSAIRMGKGIRDQRQPDMGLTPSSR